MVDDVDGGDDEYLTMLEVVVATGATRRQLGHWIQLGYLRAVYLTQDGRPARDPKGSRGVRVLLDCGQAEVARRMARLVTAGLSPDAAARAVRDAGRLGNGIVVTINGRFP